MKKTVLFTLLFVGTAVALNAQTEICKLLTDSITMGSEATSFEKYIYNNDQMLVKVEKYDSNQMMYYYFDTLMYNAQSQLVSVEERQISSTTIRQKTTISYDGNDISRVAIQGNYGNGDWAMAHDINYTNGKISSVVLDESSISGPVEGFTASFYDVVWSNGNLMSVTLIGELEEGVIDSLELVVTYDTKINFEKLMYIDEAADLLTATNTNNLLNMKFVNDESMGNAGTIAMSRSYEYANNDQVNKVTYIAGVFESKTSTHELTLDCYLSIGKEDVNSTLRIYPNPTDNLVNFKINKTINNGTISVYTMLGGLILQQNYTNFDFITLNIENLPQGLYFIKSDFDKQTYVTKVLKR